MLGDGACRTGHSDATFRGPQALSAQSEGTVMHRRTHQWPRQRRMDRVAWATAWFGILTAALLVTAV
jgi:hypothetical protein